MLVTITKKHWDTARQIDRLRGQNGRTKYCPIAQCLMEMGFPNVEVVVNPDDEYDASYGGTYGIVTGCGETVARTFDADKEPHEGLLPCTFELPDAS